MVLGPKRTLVTLAIAVGLLAPAAPAGAHPIAGNAHQANDASVNFTSADGRSMSFEMAPSRPRHPVEAVNP
jgi:hypothetical protein